MRMPTRLLRLHAFFALILTIMMIPGYTQEPQARPDHPSQLSYPAAEFHPPKPERMVLSNGIRLYLLQDNSIPQVRFHAILDAGSIHEESRDAGLASLTASLLRVGGSTVVSATEMNAKLEFAGAELEVNGGRDLVHASLRVLSKDLEMGISMLAEVLLRPAFPAARLEQRRAEVLELLRRQDDDPMAISIREFRKLLYGDHPYGRDMNGNPETVSKFTREDLLRWHGTWYHPDRVVFAVAGDFQRETLLEMIQTHFGGWANSGTNPTLPEVKLADTAGARYLITKDLNQSTVRMGHLGIRRNNPDAITLEVLNFILGSGDFSSRLVNKVRTEAGYTYSIASIFDQPLMDGQFVVIFQTKTDNVVPAIELTVNTIRELVEQGNITPEEISLAKESKLNEFIFLFEKPSDVVYQYATLDYFGMPDDYLETYRDKIAAVTLEDLKTVARKYLHPDQFTFLVVGHPEVKSALEKTGTWKEIPLPEEKVTSPGSE